VPSNLPPFLHPTSAAMEFFMHLWSSTIMVSRDIKPWSFLVLCFLHFSVLFSSSSPSILFFSFTFTVHCLLHCVSPLIPCNYETTRVFYTLFVDFLASYDSHHLLAFLYISAPFYCFHCVSCHFYSVILFSFQFPPFNLCYMSCSCFLLHVSSIFHHLQSFSALA